MPSKQVLHQERDIFFTKSSCDTVTSCCRKHPKASHRCNTKIIKDLKPIPSQAAPSRAARDSQATPVGPTNGGCGQSNQGPSMLRYVQQSWKWVAWPLGRPSSSTNRGLSASMFVGGRVHVHHLKASDTTKGERATSTAGLLTLHKPRLAVSGKTVPRFLSQRLSVLLPGENSAL